jgi:hypothetical protein
MDDARDTPERLMKYAAEGRLTKHALATTLTAEPRRVFLDACAAIERRYTDECSAAKDPCLASGCAVEGEVCLEPLLRAGTHYHRACAAEWVKLYADRENRVDSGLSFGVVHASEPHGVFHGNDESGGLQRKGSSRR